MEEIITLLDSFISILMFFCVVFMFAKLINDKKLVYIVGEIVFSTLIVLAEVAIMYYKGGINENIAGNTLAFVVCLIYALANVVSLESVIKEKRELKMKKRGKFDRKV